MAAAKDKDNEVTVTATKADVDQENIDNVPENEAQTTAKGDDVEVSSNKEANNPFFVSNVDPTDPNGYNNAPHGADGFIKNPVAGGAVPSSDDGAVVNGVTQIDGDDLPESNVDPHGVISKNSKSKGKRK